MPNKKVIDILPPEKRKKIIEREKKEQLPLKNFLASPKKRFFKTRFKKIFLFALFCFILVAGFFHFSLFKAEIEIWPETRLLSLERELKISENEVYVFEEEITLSRLFQSSGTIIKEEKASGLIRVYNEYSTAPQTLIAATRFVSSDGKVFRTPVSVTIPGGYQEGGRFVPGEIDIEVVADESGPQYNIGPTTFSIPGFAGTDRYTKFYAKSFQSMSGGRQEETPKIIEADLVEAEKKTIEAAKVKCREELSDKFISRPELTEFYYFSEEIETEILDKFSLSLAGEEKKDFTYQVKAVCRTLSFKENHLKNYAREAIKAEILEEEQLLDESLEINYLDRKVDLAENYVDLSIQISALIHSKIDFDQLQHALAGHSLNESQALLESQPQITRARIDFRPFWLRKFPRDPDRAHFSLRFD